MIRFATAFLAACLLFVMPLHAESAKNLTISNGWIAIPKGNMPMAAGYMIVENPTKKAVNLIAASASEELCKAVELHTHSMQDGRLRMRKIDSVPVPKKDKVHFRPGGLHIMLIGLKKQLLDGDQIDLTFTFDNGEEIKQTFTVKPRS